MLVILGEIHRLLNAFVAKYFMVDALIMNQEME